MRIVDVSEQSKNILFLFLNCIICIQFITHTSLKDSSCIRQFSSYRATFELPKGQWTTVRLPWSEFNGFGWGAVENLLDHSALRRLGIVAIGKEMDVSLALSSIRFMKD